MGIDVDKTNMLARSLTAAGINMIEKKTDYMCGTAIR
jgi:hypothetical protein